MNPIPTRKDRRCIRFRSLLRIAFCSLLPLIPGSVVHASDMRPVLRRFVEYGIREQLAEQAALIDSLAGIGGNDAMARTLAGILRARVAVVGGHVAEAEKLLDDLGAPAQNADPVVLLAWFETRSNIHRANQAWGLAQQEAEHAYDLATAFAMDHEEVDAIILLAAIERGRGVFQKAMDLGIEAQKKAEALDYKAGLAKALMLRGNINYDRDRFEAAKALHRQCFTLSMANGFTQFMKLSIGNLAAAIQPEPDSVGVAMQLYKQAIGFAQRTGDHDLEADWRTALGTLMADAGQYVEARKEIRQALAFFEGQGDTVNVVHALYSMAGLHAAEGQRDSALLWAQQCLELSKAVPVLRRIVDSELLICELLSNTGDPRLYQHLEQYKVMRDSLERAISNEMLVEKEVQFETEKTEMELAKTAVERDAEMAIRQRREIQRNAVIAVSILLIVLSFILYRNLRHRKRLAKKERELYEQQMGDVMRQSEIRSLDALMQGQEMERKRVAKDLHDRLGSMLSAIKHQFSVLESKVEAVREENKVQYDHVFSMLDDAVGEVRRISHDMLKSSLAQFGLAGALDDLREALAAPGKLEVEMSLFGLEERLEQKVEIAVFRMVQECVGNALKHAKATAITIQVTRSTAMLNVIVEDNGKGFDTTHVNEGMGLGNLRQRAAEVGGAVQFDSAPGRGTIVTIDVPLA